MNDIKRALGVPLKWMVMSATELTSKNPNRARCFELNATDLETEEEAKIEAKRRNEIEKAAGHTNVEWYPCPQLDMSQFLGGQK